MTKQPFSQPCHILRMIASYYCIQHKMPRLTACFSYYNHSLYFQNCQDIFFLDSRKKYKLKVLYLKQLKKTLENRISYLYYIMSFLLQIVNPHCHLTKLLLLLKQMPLLKKSQTYYFIYCFTYCFIILTIIILFLISGPARA